MQEYVGLARGHMEFLIRALDGDPGAHRLPDIAPLPAEFDMDWPGSSRISPPDELALEPRRQWPTGGLPQMGATVELRSSFRRSRAKCFAYGVMPDGRTRAAG